MTCQHCTPARATPGDPRMDMAVLSAMMQAPDTAIPGAVMLLNAGDFSTPAAGLVFDVICRRHDAGKPVDLVSLAGHLFEKNMMESVGGPSYLSECYTATSDPRQVAHHAAAVLDASKRRQLARIGAELALAAIAPHGEAQGDWRDALAAVLRKAETILMDGKARELQHVREVIAEYADAFEAGLEKNLDPAVPTGIGALDKILDGGIRREYILIGGRQGHGKTLLAMQMAGKLANEGRRGLVVGYEMTARNILMRDIAREARVPLNQVMGRAPAENHAFHAITRGLGRMLEGWDVFYTESPYITLESVASHARALHRIKPLDFIVIDYLQLVPMKRAGKERSDEMLVAVSYQAERLRKELGCTLIAPVQLNDDGLIRGARGILDAPQVFIRIEMEEVANGEGTMESGDDGFLKILKNRFGGSNRACPVFRNGPCQNFEDREHTPAPLPSPKTRQNQHRNNPYAR